MLQIHAFHVCQPQSKDSYCHQTRFRLECVAQGKGAKYQPEGTNILEKLRNQVISQVKPEKIAGNHADKDANKQQLNKT